MEEQESEFKPGEAVIYQNGDSFELGIIKRVGNSPNTYFVYYHTGDTAACTPEECLHKIKNGYAFKVERLDQAKAEAPKKVPLSEIIKDPNKVIHCPREDEAKTLLAELDKRGLHWRGDISNTNYESYHEKTCYYPNCGQYCEKSFYENNGNEVIEFSDVDLTK